MLVKGQNQVSFDYQDGFGSVLLSTPKGETKADDIDSAWLRKPYGFGDVGFVESINDPVQRGLAAKEVTAMLSGLFALLNDRYWLNNPSSITRAQSKPYQLSLARKIGLKMPDSIITNDPATAKAFCRIGPTVFKPLAETTLVYEERTLAVETTLLTDAHISQLDLIKSQPVLLQACIDKHCELRVTYVDGKVFVARQELAPNYSNNIIDWRSLQGTPDSSYVHGELTSETTHKIRLLMQELDLRFGALDFAVDQDGNEFFLEVNPNGQWLGYTDKIGLPAAAEIARCLVNQTDSMSMDWR
jgi:glutathione synthase/RimK-type ligase-like ATP-grasp enzyme